MLSKQFHTKWDLYTSSRVDTWARDTVKLYWSADTLFWQLSIDHNIDVQYVSICALKLARNYEIEHWSRSSKTNGQRTASK